MINVGHVSNLEDRKEVDYVVDHIYKETFTLSDDNKFSFNFISSSDGGHYGTWWQVEVEFKKQSAFARNADSKVAIIVGLPSSGKTTNMENNFDSASYVVLDDFLSCPTVHALAPVKALW